ncbi:MAG: hypothetical protein KIT09_21650 [Bryobacteraceae bacterium]|nr:hypothetical protein [Bryobacteraceae bacterium]
MPSWMVFAAYGGSVFLALLLLYLFRRKTWYWHILALVAAFVIGLTPPPESIRGSRTDVVIGSIFFFLFFWGVCAPLFGRRRTQINVS